MKTRSHRRSWFDHPTMCVVGCIDAYGSITGRACKEVEVHTPAEARGKRWRWMVWTQNFHGLAPRTIKEDNNRQLLQLNDEEHFRVCDWLIARGYADESILPKVRTQDKKKPRLNA